MLSYNSIESIIKIYKYVRKLKYAEKPDYDIIKYFILKDLEAINSTLEKKYEWTDCKSTKNLSPSGFKPH